MTNDDIDRLVQDFHASVERERNRRRRRIAMSEAALGIVIALLMIAWLYLMWTLP